MTQVVTSKVWFGTYFSYIMLHQWQMYVGIQYWWQRHSLLHECVCRRVCCISILLWILWRESQVLLVTNLSSARHLRTPVALTLKPRSQHVNWTVMQFTSSSVNSRVGIHVLRTKRPGLAAVSVSIHTNYDADAFCNWVDLFCSVHVLWVWTRL